MGHGLDSLLAHKKFTGGEWQTKFNVSRGPGPEDPRTKDKDQDLGYTLNLVCHSPPVNFLWASNESKPCPIELSIQDEIQDNIQDNIQDFK